MEERTSLQIADYVVIVAMLMIPLGIGLFFAIRDAKKTTRDEYLLGGRRMTLIPVTLSIFVTYQSAISLMGFPSEVYLHGPMTLGIYPGIIFVYLLTAYTLVPLLYPLQFTSIYEYLEMRFESRLVRMICTVMGIVQNFFYLTIALLAPGLALEAAAGIPLWQSVVMVGAIGTVYTAAGGIKSVIWTDTFQCVVMAVGIYGVMIKSSYDVGGVQKVFQIAEDGGRTRFDSISPDWRVRHTWWNTFLGGGFMWIGQMLNQSTLQRISSMRSMRDARRAMLINIPTNLLYGVTLIALGWCLYAYLYNIRCDPIQAGILTNSNQLGPYFVLHTMHEVPGMAGLYMSSLFSAALSTLSSGINSMAANTVEDLLQKPLRSVSEKTATTITKVIVIIYGMAIIAMTYLVKSAKGPITQMSISVVGLFGSSLSGIFLLGCTVPWANKYGAVVGAFFSLAINLWLGIGTKLYGRVVQPLHPVPSDQCFNVTRTDLNLLQSENSTHYLTTFSNDSGNINEQYLNPLPEKFSPYDISYIWFSVIGCMLCYIVGLIISRITRSKVRSKTDSKLILPILRRFWNMSDVVTCSDTDLDSFTSCQPRKL